MLSEKRYFYIQRFENFGEEYEFLYEGELWNPDAKFLKRI